MLQRGGVAASSPEVTFEDVVAREDSAGVLEVCSAAEHAAGHVTGSANAAHTRLAAHRDCVPAGTPTHVHGQNGVRAAVASAFLARAGHDVRCVTDAFPHDREIAPDATEAGEQADA